MKETNSLKREKLEVESQNDQLKKEMERIHLLLLKHAGQWDQELLDALESEDPEHDITPKNTDANTAVEPSGLQNLSELVTSPSETEQCNMDESRPERDYNNSLGLDKDSCVEEYILQGAVPKHAVEMYVTTKENAVDRDVDDDEDFEDEGRIEMELTVCGEVTESLSKTDMDFNCKENEDTLSLNRRFSQQTDIDVLSLDKEHLLQKLSMLQLRLDEASKTVQAERE